MNFFQRRRYKKMTQHLLHEARHVRHMREDIAHPGQLRELAESEAALQAAWARRDAKQWDAAAERLSAAAATIYPPKSFAKLRENIEILAVALAVAMGFRTYFIQPFKIPTGSMQPTLYGITVTPQKAPGAGDKFPLNLVSMALFGERYVQVKATVSGPVDPRYGVDEESMVFFIGGVPHKIRRGLELYFSPGDNVIEGQILAAGRVKLGDHIFVDKVRYNFSRPKRGDIIVFSTDHINYPRIRPNSFYIKRLAALPGESVAIDPPYLLINGQRITEPYPFQRLLNERDKGYMGYTLAHRQGDASAFLADAGASQLLGPDEFLPLGDNTAYSLDGRYFGPVTDASLVGPAMIVYWPITPRIGRVK